jgi:prevent-host-death family protein
LGTQAYLSYSVRMPANTSAEIGIRELRAALSDVVNETAVYGRITYVTSRGRRVAAIVPVPDAQAIEAKKQPEGSDSPA